MNDNIKFKPPRRKFSGTVQLAYLKSKFRIRETDLQHEMTHYYSEDIYELTQTKYGKVTAVTVQPGAKRKPISGKLFSVSQRAAYKARSTPQGRGASWQHKCAVPPTVIVKKRRIV
jgi:hypothetical protein